MVLRLTNTFLDGNEGGTPTASGSGTYGPIRLLNLLYNLESVTVLRSFGRNTAPGSPAEGACYFIGSAPSGDWAGQERKIARYAQGAWEFISPTRGHVYGNATTGALFYFNGTSMIALPLDAASLSYDNSGSGLIATNVEDAIDEVNVGNLRYQVGIVTPTTRADGSPLEEGDLFGDAGTNTLKFYDGTNFVAVGGSGSSTNLDALYDLIPNATATQIANLTGAETVFVERSNGSGVQVPLNQLPVSGGTTTDLETLWDVVTPATAAEIAALDGNETVIVELDNGTLREVAISDLPTASGAAPAFNNKRVTFQSIDSNYAVTGTYRDTQVAPVDLVFGAGANAAATALEALHKPAGFYLTTYSNGGSAVPSLTISAGEQFVVISQSVKSTGGQ